MQFGYGYSKQMKKKFVAVYDYGTGGVWFYFFANNAGEITAKYPFLAVVNEEPEFLKDPIQRANMEQRSTFDIDDSPPAVLVDMLKADAKAKSH